MPHIQKKDLVPGDILLCSFKHPGKTAYIDAFLTALKYRNYNNDADRIKFLTAALTILRGLIITFDRDIYTHAAFWNGEAIVEAGLSGVKANPIEHYIGTPTDIYRFQKEGFELDSKEFPVEPLLKTAEDLVNKNLNYSYDTAYLYIFLCLTRWKRNEWIEEIESFLKTQISSKHSKYIELIFTQFHVQIVMLFENFADEVINQVVAFRKDKGLVCSETVAYIYNRTKPDGKYHIEKPLTSFQTKSHQNNQISSTKESVTTEQLDEIVSYLNSFESIMNSPTSSSNITWESVADITYTPHDLARSINTRLVGQLDLR